MTVKTYQVLVCGQVVARYARKHEALAEADRLDREAAEETGEEPVGDGAASVYDMARSMFVRRES